MSEPQGSVQYYGYALTVGAAQNGFIVDLYAITGKQQLVANTWVEVLAYLEQVVLTPKGLPSAPVLIPPGVVL